MRFSKADWISLGVRQLESEGPSGLTVDALCAAAGRTRGSFYHHFDGHEDFIEALMKYWKERDTHIVISEIEKIAADQTDALNERASALNHKLEGRVRQLAQQSEKAAKILKQVDSARISFLKKLLCDTCGLCNEQAETIAKIEYAMTVGAQLLWPNAKPNTLATLGASFTKLVRTAYGDRDG